jgi:hypothetical protein
MVSRQMVATDPVLEPVGSVGSPKNHLLTRMPAASYRGVARIL